MKPTFALPLLLLGCQDSGGTRTRFIPIDAEPRPPFVSGGAGGAGGGPVGGFGGFGGSDAGELDAGLDAQLDAAGGAQLDAGDVLDQAVMDQGALPGSDRQVTPWQPEGREPPRCETSDQCTADEICQVSDRREDFFCLMPCGPGIGCPDGFACCQAFDSYRYFLPDDVCLPSIDGVPAHHLAYSWCENFYVPPQPGADRVVSPWPDGGGLPACDSCTADEACLTLPFNGGELCALSCRDQACPSGFDCCQARFGVEPFCTPTQHPLRATVCQP